MWRKLRKRLANTVARSVAVVLLGWVTASASAGEFISVMLQSGRTFNAEVHSRTTSQRLWLQFGPEQTSILRPIDWNLVASATHAGRKLTPAELKTIAPTLAKPKPKSKPLAEVTIPSP